MLEYIYIATYFSVNEDIVVFASLMLERRELIVIPLRSAIILSIFNCASKETTNCANLRKGIFHFCPKT